MAAGDNARQHIENVRWHPLHDERRQHCSANVGMREILLVAGLPFLGRCSERVSLGMPDETFGGRLFPDAPKCQRLKHGVVLTDKHDPTSKKMFLVQYEELTGGCCSTGALAAV